jgi:hypothetical protein
MNSNSIILHSINKNTFKRITKPKIFQIRQQHKAINLQCIQKLNLITCMKLSLTEFQ